MYELYCCAKGAIKTKKWLAGLSECEEAYVSQAQVLWCPMAGVITASKLLQVSFA